MTPANSSLCRRRSHDVCVASLRPSLYAVASCAVLCCAVLCCAVLCCAVLCCAVLCCAVLWDLTCIAGAPSVAKPASPGPAAAAGAGAGAAVSTAPPTSVDPSAHKKKTHLRSNTSASLSFLTSTDTVVAADIPPPPPPPPSDLPPPPPPPPSDAFGTDISAPPVVTAADVERDNRVKAESWKARVHGTVYDANGGTPRYGWDGALAALVCVCCGLGCVVLCCVVLCCVVLSFVV
jgi:hypothetical protein